MAIGWSGLACNDAFTCASFFHLHPRVILVQTALGTKHKVGFMSLTTNTDWWDGAMSCVYFWGFFPPPHTVVVVCGLYNGKNKRRNNQRGRESQWSAFSLKLGFLLQAHLTAIECLLLRSEEFLIKVYKGYEKKTTFLQISWEYYCRKSFILSLSALSVQQLLKNVTATHLSSEILNWICRNIKTNPLCLRLTLYHSLMMER